MLSPDITIIGTGGLGSALARGLNAKDISIKSIFNRTKAKATLLARQIEVERSGTFPNSTVEVGELIFLTVPDRCIKPVSSRLASLDDEWSNKTVVHCSGNESADLLDDLKQKGATTASFHPLQTFPPESSPDRFEDIYFNMQGDPSAFPLLKRIAEQLEANSFEVDDNEKSHLHAAAVIASNYLHTILDIAVGTAVLGGLSREESKKALLPLVKQTVENAEKFSLEDSLTGPIERGDISTVKKHLKLLEKNELLRDIYVELGRSTVSLAARSGAISEETADQFYGLLK
ncbi:Rossmann-like and DUF2520 domain-containing protein [Fodinibius saliphilus]|uniref:Rossmann-like and DUF2520 domain-containing protein n=1 Tax=Fodinibius saliphilus TaxID=1920650 RepID=UPI001109EB9A|nr:Rossmann-like and DUF2520 domain-containing protein [Fodinibius saliphilus]